MALRDGAFGLLPVVEAEPAALATFTCGKAHLDSFLAESSTGIHLARLGLTTVVFHADLPDKLVGYFTLSNDGIPLTPTEQFEFGLSDHATLTSYPAVKLGRLAIAQDLQRRWIGAQLMDLVFGEILDSNSLSATRLVIVDADNNSDVVAFYRGRGFVHSLWAERQTRNHAPGGRSRPQANVKMLKDILQGD